MQWNNNENKNYNKIKLKSNVVDYLALAILMCVKVSKVVIFSEMMRRETGKEMRMLT